MSEAEISPTDAANALCAKARAALALGEMTRRKARSFAGGLLILQDVFREDLDMWAHEMLEETILALHEVE